MKTKRIIITGGPGTGKSTIINELTNRGYACLEEISRNLTQEAKKQGVDQLFLSDPLLFSERLLQGRSRQYEEAESLRSEMVFFDRGIPDVLAYMDYIGSDYPKHFVEACKRSIYDEVFILKPWKAIYISDKERYENFDQALVIHEHLINTYNVYNYKLHNVPFDTVALRTDYILNTLDSL
ncbi:AAA family ATPase [Snuella sedimenti]|uniref:ATP-binding protein n=1 Tax=Snuella sedimenti TaxID=2798802 RepID=A0A8J7LP56_9FLAO|nr:ATP-binding protein [Snuella sedimenti]MBJ6368848.1 ATP-binding protein [Snuella sedimenti]